VSELTAGADWNGPNHLHSQGANALFILLGAIMVLAMHAGFAFLELGTVRKKNQVNALVKILVDFAVSTIAYFFVGYLRGLWHPASSRVPRPWRCEAASNWSSSSFC
jgi:ammonia channel protein AmtB